MYGTTVTFRIYAYSNLANCKFTLMQYTAMPQSAMPGIEETHQASTGKYCISDSTEDRRLVEKSVSNSTRDQRLACRESRILGGLGLRPADNRLERRQHRTVPVEASGKLNAT